jgi:cytochrome c oxidase subunit IV
MKPADTVRRFVLVWVALIAFLLATFGSAYIPMGPWNGVLNLAISVAKALLVAIFFMHLKTDRPILRMPAAAALFTLALLFSLSLADYLTRPMFPAPYQPPQGTIAKVR